MEHVTRTRVTMRPAVYHRRQGFRITWAEPDPSGLCAPRRCAVFFDDYDRVTADRYKAELKAGASHADLDRILGRLTTHTALG